MSVFRSEFTRLPARETAPLSAPLFAPGEDLGNALLSSVLFGEFLNESFNDARMRSPIFSSFLQTLASRCIFSCILRFPCMGTIDKLCGWFR